jgi:hypothetical protein
MPDRQRATGAKAFLREVSSPGSKMYHRYLTDAAAAVLRRRTR